MTVAYHDSLYVASLCVAHEHRGRGVGSLLMRSASSHAASRGLPALSGSVFGGSTSLTDFYVSLGGTLGSSSRRRNPARAAAFEQS